MLPKDTPSIVRHAMAAFGLLLLCVGSLLAGLVGKAVGFDLGAALCYGWQTLRGGPQVSGTPVASLVFLAILLGTNGGGIALLVSGQRRPRRDALFWAIAPLAVFALGVLGGGERCVP